MSVAETARIRPSLPTWLKMQPKMPQPSPQNRLPCTCTPSRMQRLRTREAEAVVKTTSLVSLRPAAWRAFFLACVLTWPALKVQTFLDSGRHARHHAACRLRVFYSVVSCNFGCLFAGYL